MYLAKILEKITPGIIRKYNRIKRDKKNDEDFADLTVKEAFEKIYEDGLWKAGDQQSFKYCSGDGSHNSLIVDAYVCAIREFFSKHDDLGSAVDLGCGDFNVGSKIFDLFDQYAAVDVAGNVIAENKKKYQKDGLIFKSLNITEDELPAGDVAFARQVLQHLSNDEISKFLKNVEGKYRCLIVTESICDSKSFQPNIDIVTGPGIRIHKKSGVDITKEPFNFKFSKEETILNVNKGREIFLSKAYWF